MCVYIYTYMDDDAVQLLSHVRLLALTVACQAPLSIGFPRQEYWSGLLFPSPADLCDPEIRHVSPALADGSFPTEPPRKPQLRGKRNMLRCMSRCCEPCVPPLVKYSNSSTANSVYYKMYCKGGYQGLWGSSCFRDAEFQFCEMRTSMEGWMVVTVAQSCECD